VSSTPPLRIQNGSDQSLPLSVHGTNQNRDQQGEHCFLGFSSKLEADPQQQGEPPAPGQMGPDHSH